MRRIYIAGPLSPKGLRPEAPHPTIEYLMNVRDMVQAAIVCIERGWAPFCPALDFMYFMCLPFGMSISEDKCKGVSMAWLEASDAILLVGNWTKSRGVLAERDRAIDLGIPIYGSLDDVPRFDT